MTPSMPPARKVLPPLSKRLLDTVPEQGEISLAELLRVSGMRLEETIPVLAELIDDGWIVAMRERRGGSLTRLFRRAVPGERADQERSVIYDGAAGRPMDEKTQLGLLGDP